MPNFYLKEITLRPSVLLLMSKTTHHSMSSLHACSILLQSIPSIISNPTKSNPDGNSRMLSIHLCMYAKRHACMYAQRVLKLSLGQVHTAVPMQSIQSSHGVILHVAAPSPISKRNRSSFHSVYMSIVALMASLWPGPTLAGRASAMLRHIPKRWSTSWNLPAVGKWDTGGGGVSK